MWEKSRIKNCLQQVKQLISNEIILYGAGTYGKKTWQLLSPQLRKKVIAFAVSENGGNQLFGLPIQTISELTDFCHTATVIICATGEKVRDMNNTLSSLGFSSWMTFNEDVLLYASAVSQLQEETQKRFLAQFSMDDDSYDEEELCNIALSIGKFIHSLGDEGLTFSRLPFVWGGSGILDYALLRGLAIKYSLKSYLEVGTYIGASLACLDDVVEHCFSVTVPPDDPRHMRYWCEARHMKDFSNCLVDEKVAQFLEDSTYVDYSRTEMPIDLYFIDGDHSYRGVFIDSIKIFDHFDPERSFVVWHDCRTAQGIATEVVFAVHDAIGEYWRNFFVFDVGCMCGIYISPCYQKDFAFAKQSDGLVTYKVILQQNQL